MYARIAFQSDLFGIKNTHRENFLIVNKKLEEENLMPGEKLTEPDINYIFDKLEPSHPLFTSSILMLLQL